MSLRRTRPSRDRSPEKVADRTLAAFGYLRALPETSSNSLDRGTGVGSCRGSQRQACGARVSILTPIHYQGNVAAMAIAQSKLTAQGQISVPSEVRKKLGIGPGSVLEWDEQDGQVIVRRAGRYDWND